MWLPGCWQCRDQSALSLRFLHLPPQLLVQISMWFIPFSSSVGGAWSGGENPQDLAHRSHKHRRIGQDNIPTSSIGFRVYLTLLKFWLCYKQLCDLGCCRVSLCCIGIRVMEACFFGRVHPLKVKTVMEPLLGA